MKDYVSVIAKKSELLKNLTQDLFDISKVQSGNDEIVLEKLDVSLLFGQALGEHDNEIQNSDLQFCVDTPKELFISADGRKMSRVLSNLINNIFKYTMKNTRVFISATEKSNFIEIELKNISTYPLNFDAEEITADLFEVMSSEPPKAMVSASPFPRAILRFVTASLT